jgi:hypothetical protein
MIFLRALNYHDWAKEGKTVDRLCSGTQQRVGYLRRLGMDGAVWLCSAMSRSRPTSQTKSRGKIEVDRRRLVAMETNFFFSSA